MKYALITLLALVAISPVQAQTTATEAATTAPAAPAPPAQAPVQLEGGVEITDLKVGTGDPVTSGMSSRIHYIGRLSSGTVFQNSRKQIFPSPLEVPGPHGVIRGLEIGMEGMRVGGVRVMRIPAALGYGSRGNPPVIPPDSDLEFEVELVDVLPKKEPFDPTPNIDETEGAQPAP